MANLPAMPAYPDASLGLSWASIGSVDVDAWFDLTAAIDAVDEPVERYTRDDLEDELTDGSWKDPEQDSLLGRAPDGTVVAFGLVEPLPGATVRRVLLWGGVHPRWRRRGVGRELLRWQLDRADELLAVPVDTTARPAQGAWESDVSWRVQLSHPERLTDRSDLAAAAGLTAVRWFHDLGRELTTPGAPVVPDLAVAAPLQLATYAAEHEEPLRLAHNDAFAGHWGSQPRTVEAWRTQLVRQRNFRPDWTFLALDPTQPEPDGRPAIAGYATGAAFEQDWEAQGFTQGWTGLLGVRPAWRGRGIAPALLAEQLRAFAAAGLQKAGLDVDSGNASGALSLYAGMGYEVETTSVVWAREG